LLTTAVFKKNALLANHKQIGSHYCALANSLFLIPRKVITVIVWAMTTVSYLIPMKPCLGSC